MGKGTKINQILQQLPSGVVFLSGWLKAQGCSYELQQRYRKSGWLTSIGQGAMVRSGQKLLISGAIYALQRQAGKQIHIGGRTALDMQGYAHYIELESKETLLFAGHDKKLPNWVKNNNWDTKPTLFNSSFLPQNAGLIDFKTDGFKLRISGAARAIMECLELTPRRFELVEAYEIMEGLSFLKPDTVQLLLEQCKSVKVKRLFLYFAEKANHAWFRHLQLNKINLGSGKRSMVKNGVLIPKYQITLPKNLV
ncbi:MAG TPA: hypothetical protein ENI57_01205 [Ignavibacteria bacterium]|nr:hypothetical protein [Ignavibacteria bacterium]